MAKRIDAHGQQLGRGVIPDGSGGWVSVRPGAAGSSTRHATRADALQAAKRQVEAEGGGEVRGHDADARIHVLDENAELLGRDRHN